MRFSIIIVSLNAGDKLYETVKNAMEQTCRDIEILVKDGGSTDGSIEKLSEFGSAVRIIEKKDSSIYDAMNQAVLEAKGEYFIFMNAGDVFADEKVLAKTVGVMIKDKADIYYGDMYRKGTDTIIPYPSKLTMFGLYRNVPCHQVCFYSRRLFKEKAYDTSYKVRADYEHFVRSVCEKKAITKHLDFPVCIYEGGGFSETKESLRKSSDEHKTITKKYMGMKSYLYRGIMIVTLQPVRQRLAESEKFSGLYQSIKRKLYLR